MWRVTATDREGREIGRVEIEVGDLSIGRDADRQMILSSPSVSRRHCRLRIDGNGPVMLDEGSANGVIIDGVRINGPKPVNQFSRIEVAEFRITLEQLGAPRSAQPPMQPPMMSPQMQPGMPMGMQPGVPMGMPPQMQPGMPMGMQPGMPMGMDPSSMAVPMGAMGGVVPGGMVPPMQGGDLVRLIAEGGTYDGRAFDLPPLPEISVGRAMDNDLVLDDPSLSRKHSKLRRVGGGRLDVEDTNSANGTYVNGRKINPGSRQQVGPGDTLRFGELMFRVDGAAGVSRPGGQPAPGPSSRGASKGVQIGFFGLVGVALLVFIVALSKLLAAPSGPPKGALEEAIRTRIHEADPLIKQAQVGLDEKNWDRAKEAARLALDIAPANLEAAKVWAQAVRSQADEVRRKEAIAELDKVSVEGMQGALRKFQEISDGSAAKQEVAEKLVDRLVQVGTELVKRKSYHDAAFMLCEAYRVAPQGRKPREPVQKMLRDAEKKAHSTSPCNI